MMLFIKSLMGKLAPNIMPNNHIGTYTPIKITHKFHRAENLSLILNQPEITRKQLTQQHDIA